MYSKVAQAKVEGHAPLIIDNSLMLVESTRSYVESLSKAGSSDHVDNSFAGHAIQHEDVIARHSLFRVSVWLATSPDVQEKGIGRFGTTVGWSRAFCLRWCRN